MQDKYPGMRVRKVAAGVLSINILGILPRMKEQESSCR
jgi:hypothetical protein